MDGNKLNNLFRLDGKHTVFGKVIEGMDVVNAISAAGSANGEPKAQVIVTDSGVLEEAQKQNNNHGSKH